MSNQPYSLPGQQAPFSQEAEEAVIGAVLVNAEAFLTVSSFLQPEDFYIIRNQYIWEAMVRIAERNEPIDYLTLQDELRGGNRLNDIGGPAYITHLINSVPTSVHAEIYGRLVERAAIRRRLLIAGDEIKALALDEETAIEKVTTDAEARLFKVTERNIRRDMVTLREALGDYFERVENMMQYGTTPGLPTGFRDIDTLLGGMQRSDLMIFAGRPGMGKCVAAGTMIPTDIGYLPIEELKPKDVAGITDDEGGIFYPLNIMVLTPEGAKQTSHFYDSGNRPARRLTTRAGYNLTATYTHPVLTLSPDGVKIWKPMTKLQVGDFVAVQRHKSLWGNKTKTPDFEFDFTGISYIRRPNLPKSINSETDYFLGLLVGDANLTQKNYVHFSMAEPEFYWDAITHIEDAGIQHCYDLTVPDGHAFVANGIVNHNTSFLLSVTSNAAKYNGRIAIFSMEMGADQIVQRLISMETGINSQRLRLGQLNQQEWNKFVQATGRMGNLKIFIDDSPALTPLQLRTKCRRLVHEYGLDLVVVDYLQLMNAGSGYENNRVQEISYISRSLKELARELNVPVFTAAQLSRAVEQRQDKRPQLSDLRESGSIEQDADIVMFLYRDIVYNEATDFPNRADVIVAKHRNGPTGVVSLHFENSLTKFTDAKTQMIDLTAL